MRLPRRAGNLKSTRLQGRATWRKELSRVMNSSTMISPRTIPITTTRPAVINVNGKQKDSARVLPTSTLLDSLLVRVENATPLNLHIFTDYIRATFIDRLAYLESLCIDTRFVRLFTRVGIPATWPFLVIFAFGIWSLNKAYGRSSSLVATCLGVLYPAYKSIQAVDLADLIEGAENDETETSVDGARETLLTAPPTSATKLSTTLMRRKLLSEQKQWLTYWFLFGWLQVVDHFADVITDFIPGWEYIKLLSMWWAQNPQSRGASVIYDTIIRSLLREPGAVPSRPQRSVIDRRKTTQHTYVVKRPEVIEPRSPSIEYVPEEKVEDIWAKSNGNTRPYAL